MKLRIGIVLILVATGLTARAGGQKEPDKKKEAPPQDVVVTGELTNADLKDRVHAQSFAKTFTFKMEKDKPYHIDLTGTGFQAILRLENGAGTALQQSSSNFGSANVFYRPMKSEDFSIVVTTQDAGAVGKFTLTIKTVEKFDGKPIELKNVLGPAETSGILHPEDPVRNGKRHRVYLFQMEQGKTYQIDMTSKAFDSYLFLESPGGKQLAADDDGGGYPSARIVHKAAETGQHRIITTYFGNGQGTFNLAIKQTN